MANGAGTMTFLAFPREIRDLIYEYFNTNDIIYSITPTKVATVEEFPTPNLDLINTCKTVRDEMIERLFPHNTFRYLFSYSDTNTQYFYHEYANFATSVDFDIDLSPFPPQSFRPGHLDPTLHHFSEQVCDAISWWNSHPIRRESCRISIKDTNTSVAPLLRLRIFEVIRTLSGFETVLINMLTYKSDLMVGLRPFLELSLGRSTFRYEPEKWLPGPKTFGYLVSCEYHPRKFAVGMRERGGGKVLEIDGTA